MKIIHFALSNFYIEGYKYQENILPTIQSKHGHEVLMIASCVSFDIGGQSCLVEPCAYHSQDGFDVVRLPYKKHYNKGILRKLRLYDGVYSIIESFNPDIMYFHGCSALELLTIVKYKKLHPEVKLYIDNHADRNNSASSLISLFLLHKIIYKWPLSKALPYTEKLLCPSIECMDFCRNVYGVPQDKLEFYPLGGIIINANEIASISKSIRTKENIPDDAVVFTHSGKMDKNKRTIEIVKAFSAIKNPKFRLWIIGVLMQDVENEVLAEIEKDSRIIFLGWKNSNDLQDYLRATDFYVQPGGQSATMQNAMCAECAVILYPHKSHKPYIDGNGYYVSSEEDMKRVFQEVSIHPEKTAPMKERSYEIAKDLLDYDKLASRIYEGME